MAKKKRLNKAERQKRENMKWIYMFVALAVVAIGMLVFAATCSSLQESELSGQQTLEIASLKQSIEDW